MAPGRARASMFPKSSSPSPGQNAGPGLTIHQLRHLRTLRGSISLAPTKQRVAPLQSVPVVTAPTLHTLWDDGQDHILQPQKRR
eukprot:4638247-Pyramimonas_sp.AAC.1